MRKTVRAIGRYNGALVLIRREKSGQPPYYVFPGGGVEPSDVSLQDALQREISEELDGAIEDPQLVLTLEREIGSEIRQEFFFSCTFSRLSEAFTGQEANQASRGDYRVVFINSLDELVGLNVLPTDALQLVTEHWPTDR